MKRIMQMAIALLCGSAQPALAIELAHEFAVENITPSDASSLTPDEIKSIHADWLSSTDLKVSFWQMETCSTVRRSGSAATLEGDRIALSYETDKVPHEVGQPVAMCAWPVHVTFALHNLPLRVYKVIIRVGDYVRSSKVEPN